MTTHFKDTPWGRKYSTELHLIYRIENGELQPLWLFETREKAQANLALLNPAQGWRIADVTCGGWGIVDGVVRRNKMEPMTDEQLFEARPFTEKEYAWLIANDTTEVALDEWDARLAPLEKALTTLKAIDDT